MNTLICEAEWMKCIDKLPETSDIVEVFLIPREGQDWRECFQVASYMGPGTGWVSSKGYVGNEHPRDFTSPGCVSHWRPLLPPPEYRSMV